MWKIVVLIFELNAAGIPSATPITTATFANEANPWSEAQCLEVQDFATAYYVGMVRRYFPMINLKVESACKFFEGEKA